jgi:hypothetical protein
MFVFLRRKITVLILQKKMEGKRGRSPSSTPSTSQNKFRRHSHETISGAAPPSDEVRIIYGNAPDRDKRTGGGPKREESPLSSARQPHNRRDRSPSSRPATSETRQGVASNSRHSQPASAGSSGRGQCNESQPALTTFNSPLTSRRSCSDDVNMSGSVEELRRYIRSMEQERKVLEADVEAGRLKAQCHKCSWLAVPFV